MGEPGRETETPTVADYRQSVEDEFSERNLQPPQFVIEGILDYNQQIVENQLQQASGEYPHIPVYPFDTHFEHFHFDNDDLDNNLIEDIRDSNEFQSEVDFISSQIQLAVDRGFFQVPIANSGVGQIDISEDRTYTFTPQRIPIIQTQGLAYGVVGGDAGDDLENDADAFLTVGNVAAQNFVAIVNELNINSSGGERTFTADVDYYGWDSYSWSLDDFGNRNIGVFEASGINPATFGQVWALQQYGYGKPSTVSFRIEETLSTPMA